MAFFQYRRPFPKISFISSLSIISFYIARGIYINIIYRNKLITLEPGEPTLSTPLDSRIRKKRLLITCGIIVAGILYTLVSTPIGKWKFHIQIHSYQLSKCCIRTRQLHRRYLWKHNGHIK